MTDTGRQQPIPRLGEIYMVKLGPIEGSEIGGEKSRPVVVVSIHDANLNGVVTVVPGTGAAGKEGRFKQTGVEVREDSENNLKKRTIFQCHQIRAISRERFTGDRIGVLKGKPFRQIKETIAYCLGLGLKSQE